MMTGTSEVTQGVVTRVDGLQIRAKTSQIPETGWARPLAAVAAPAVGDPVWILFENGDPEYPIWAPLFSDVQAAVAGDKYVRHTQGSPAAVWTISHNMGKRPSVMIEDSLGRDIEADLDWPDNNTVTITFSAPISGTAYLN